MSGPKTSRYTLTAAQRRALLEQIRQEQERQIREERKKTEKVTLDNYCRNIDEIVAEINGVLEQIEKTVTEGGLDKTDLSSFDSNCKKAILEIEKAKNKCKSYDLNDYQSENKALATIMKNLEIDKSSADKLLRKKEDTYKNNAIEKLSNSFNISFSGIKSERALKQNEFIDKILEALDSVKNLERSKELQARYEEVKRKASEIKSVDFMENFYSITILPYVKECKKYNELWEKYGDEYETLLIRYNLLTKKVGVPAEEILFDENVVSDLLSKISALEKVLLDRKEESYICKCIDESMEELGYKVVGTRDVTKKNGKHFRNELFKFAEGTVVNVTYSDDGQITMELGAADTEDRIPTDAESRSLVEDMNSFCGEYAELEKILVKKGIETNKISILPPHSEYAQIIDISEYDMKEPVGEYSHRRANASTQQAMRREV